MSEFRLRSAYPISSNCPKCGSTDYFTVKAETLAAFTDDRVCKDTECDTRYTPPTPVWGRIVFAVIGVGILAASVGAGYVMLTDDYRFAYLLAGGGIVGFSCLYLAFASQ